MSTGDVYIQEDPNLLKMLLLSGSEEAAAINNNLIRKSFRELTDAFLHAFAEYFGLQHNVFCFALASNKACTRILKNSTKKNFYLLLNKRSLDSNHFLGLPQRLLSFMHVS